MISSIFGETNGEIVDLLVKLAPAASIVAAIIAARFQFRNARRLNQETIAKNHYREMLQLIFDNADLVDKASSPEKIERLREDPLQHRRYLWLFTIVAFSLQELFLSIDLKKEGNWEMMIRVFSAIFKYFILSERDFAPHMRQSLDPRFVAFMIESAETLRRPKTAQLLATASLT